MGGSRRDEVKILPITKGMVYDAYLKVKSNGGASGIDDLSLKEFTADLENQLYKLWNRMSSGSYFPPAVKRVNIPKRGGGQRPLGIPTVGDRIAQTVVKEFMEPRLEAIFHDSSFGYRPGRGAHDALRSADKMNRQYPWVIDLDIKGFFDAIDHDKLMLAVERHFSESWIKMYLHRWLKADVAHPNGERTAMTSGTPQGGVVSPLLANLYLHYCFDVWLDREVGLPFERYADDIIVHCKSSHQAEEVLEMIRCRMAQCNLELHPEKTKIVYCGRPKKKKEVGAYPRKYSFLGHEFKPREIFMGKGKQKFWSTRPGPSEPAKKGMISYLNELLTRRTVGQLERFAIILEPKLRGWHAYYCRFNHRALSRVMDHLNYLLCRWLANRYGRIRGTKQGRRALAKVAAQEPELFYHWSIGYVAR